jgi:hypothetical protein
VLDNVLPGLEMPPDVGIGDIARRHGEQAEKEDCEESVFCRGPPSHKESIIAGDWRAKVRSQSILAADSEQLVATSGSRSRSILFCATSSGSEDAWRLGSDWFQRYLYSRTARHLMTDSPSVVVWEIGQEVSSDSNFSVSPR